MFVYNSKFHTEDDIIEHILKLLITPGWAGTCLNVPDFCLTQSGHDYDPFIEQRVREKMYNYQVALRCPGNNQPETAIKITTKGVDIARNTGWKAFLQSEKIKMQLISDNRKRSDRAQKMLESEKNKLENEKTMLEIDKLTYERRNRELTENVQNLTTTNLRLQNADIIGKWIYSIAGALFSLLTSVIIESKFQWISKLAKVLGQILSATDS